MKMGSSCKSYGGGKSCGCNKRVKKAQRVPQRGPGVAELEKILSDQKQDHMKPLYTTTPNGPQLYNQTHYHLINNPTQHQLMTLPRPLLESHLSHFGVSGNQCVNPVKRSDSNNESGLSFTQMMMMGDPHPQDYKPNTNQVYQTNYRIKKLGGERPNHLHPAYAGQTLIENVRAVAEHENMMLGAVAEHEKMMLRNILTLEPPNPTKISSNLHLHPISIDSDSSEEQCKHKKLEESSYKTHKPQIFGFNLIDKSMTLDDTKLSLQHNAVGTEEPTLDLTLKL